MNHDPEPSWRKSSARLYRALDEAGVDPDPGPIRLCCGQRHWTVACPDGLVLCCLCYHRKPIEEMNVLPTGQREDVCMLCAEDERRRVEAKFKPFWLNAEIHGWPMPVEYKEEMERRLKEYPIP